MKSFDDARGILEKLKALKIHIVYLYVATVPRDRVHKLERKIRKKVVTAINDLLMKVVRVRSIGQTINASVEKSQRRSLSSLVYKRDNRYLNNSNKSQLCSRG